MTKQEEKKLILNEVENYIFNKLKEINRSQPYAETLYYYTQSLVNIQTIKSKVVINND